MAPEICNVWQMGCYADDMADGTAIWTFGVTGTFWEGTDVVPVCDTHVISWSKAVPIPTSAQLVITMVYVPCAHIHMQFC